jgi:alkylation response protein AidB-like acyl-CoA dehydrogenase
MATTVDRLLPTDEAEALLELTREIATRELAPQVASMEAAGTFPVDAYRLLGKSGLLSLPFDEEYGGGGQPYEVYLQVIEEIAAAWPSVAVGASVHSLTATVLATNATQEQRDEWLPKMLSGEWLGAYCLSEPQAGSDVSAIRTRAVREGDEYVVSGTKQWISNGSCADYYILFARTDEHPTKGLSAFIVPADTAGFSVGRLEEKMGLHASATGELIFQNARVPAEHLLGEQGTGFRTFLRILDGGRISIGALALGLAQAALDASIPYAQSREQFGRPIGSFQGVAFLVADMATEIEAARQMVWRAAWLKDQGREYGLAAAQAKLFASEVANRATNNGIQVHGGYGYVEEYKVERFLRDAKLTEIGEGTSQIQRLVIARKILGLRVI